MDNLEIADVLDRTHDVLLVRGRARESAVDDDGRVCVLGAVQVALGETPLFWSEACHSEVGVALGRYLAQNGECPTFNDGGVPRCVADSLFTGGYVEAWWWNDAEATTDDAVFDALRRCAKSLREEAS